MDDNGRRSSRTVRSPDHSSASSGGVRQNHDSLSPSSPSPSIDSSSSECQYNNPEFKAPVLMVTTSKSTSSRSTSSSDEVPLHGGEEIKGVYKDITYLSAYSIHGALKVRKFEL